MRIVLVGGSGTIGRRLAPALAQRHEIVVAGRTSGDIHVDITSAESIEAMYQELPGVDAVVGIAASGALDEFATLTEEQLLDNMRGKFFGQVNLVLIGQRYVNAGGSFTLTSGVFADQPATGVTGGGVVSGALHSFVLSAALELQGRYRVNVVSPTMVSDSVDEYAPLFPGLSAIPMDTLVGHYVDCIETEMTGQIIRAYG
ncbi:NAD(P)-dependent dehydrogenase (short-subunit alcohol dehydrogenase family) [Mycobacterium sp. OAS707]|uniref:short chain dehydrogenase n=1 Tax=Mycobacterium sp. OAS707 TaxID=2663822 RepID=UPI00178A6298|nr:short chain dehydrogenase [Mycobacterium sp. OAS707]MBE1546257.1 NAD(P)-dependent dehydrogenase (short-subunit alcohol dehydrogenase family) [Mycobacterium sp. OAS707]